MIRLGYLVPQFPGQTHMFFWREIKELEMLGVDVVLLSTRHPPDGVVSHQWSSAAVARTTYIAKIDPLAALVAAPKLPWGELIHEFAREPSSFRRDAIMSAPAAQTLLAVARKLGLDHVHVHSAGRAALIAALSRAMGGPSYSVTLHGPRLEDYGPGQKFKWRHAAFGTAVTEKLRTDLMNTLGSDAPDRIIVQPMGVDTVRLSRTLAWTAPRSDAPLQLFCCSRLNAVKGHEHLFTAIKKLRQRGRDIRLTIAGEDDQGGIGYRKELEADVASHGLADSVMFLGAVDEAEVKRQLLSTHFFILPSLREALPVALLEAMSCGVPSISTDVGGVSTVIENGRNGLLIPPEDPDAIATAISSLDADSELARRMGIAARETIAARFGAERGAKALLNGFLRLDS